MSKKLPKAQLFLPPSQMVHIGLALNKTGIHVIEFMVNCFDLFKVVAQKKKIPTCWNFMVIYYGRIRKKSDVQQSNDCHSAIQDDSIHSH